MRLTQLPIMLLLVALEVRSGSYRGILFIQRTR